MASHGSPVLPDDLSSRWDAQSLPPDGEENFTPFDIQPEGVTPLGHDRGVFYYLSGSAGQVFDLTASQHNKANLMAMASLPHYWERGRFFDEKKGVNWDHAIDDLMNTCRKIGIYNPNRIRGRGVWMDQDQAILHIGDRLLVDGHEQPLRFPGSRFVYEASTSLTIAGADALNHTEANALVDICKRLRWERGVSGTLLAGFIVVAPICGGLAWRPAIWIVGGSGSGKSYIYENILIPALGGTALQVQSKTSEAGIRQSLGSDARPVIFDEAESEDQASAARIQGVLDLVRQSSSDGGADIVKGSADGRAKRYRIRSCFGFLSINAGILHEADANRVSMLPLKGNRAPGKDDEQKFQALHALVTKTITPHFAAGLIARSVRLLPVIRANAETFAQAVSVHLGSRRTGDQIGTLLAGAYSLHSDRLITAEKAMEFVKRQDWTEAVTEEADRDEQRLLAHLTQHRLRVSYGNGGSSESTIGRLIAAAAGKGGSQVPGDVADEELKQIGIRVEWITNDQTGAWISTNHPGLRRILADTPWEKNWSRALLRLTGATASTVSKRFGPGSQSRATWLPIETIDPKEPTEATDPTSQAASHQRPMDSPSANT